MATGIDVDTLIKAVGGAVVGVGGIIAWFDNRDNKKVKAKEEKIDVLLNRQEAITSLVFKVILHRNMIDRIAYTLGDPPKSEIAIHLMEMEKALQELLDLEKKYPLP